LARRLDHAFGEALERGIVWVESIGAVVVQDDLPYDGVGHLLVLVFNQRSRGIGVGGKCEDPPVADQVDPAFAQSDLAELLDMPSDPGREELLVSGCEVSQPLLGVAKLADTTGQLGVELLDSAPELGVGRGSQLADGETVVRRGSASVGRQRRLWSEPTSQSVQPASILSGKTVIQ
jgi:hypothetical protein